MSKDSNKRESEILKRVHNLLHDLGNSDASFLFISGEHSFAMAGDHKALLTELLIAMIRYPVVRKLVIEAFINYPRVEKEQGDSIRSIKMDFCVEQNTGNEGN